VFEFLAGSLIELVVELLFQGGGQVLVEGAARLLGASFGRRGQDHPLAAAVGLLLLGAMLGGLSWVVWPHRIVGARAYPGVSLLVSPVVNGLLADALGSWRVNHGRPRTYVSTFWGGALFAFGCALVRFLLVPSFPDVPLER
jgi:hypothetical protein